MRFYRLEKTNYFKRFGMATLRGILIGLIVVIALMLVLGYKFMIVSSTSMEPTLPVGSMVIVTPIKYEDIQTGDIVTMDLNGIYLTHRIMGKVKIVNGNEEIFVTDDKNSEYYNEENYNLYWNDPSCRWFTRGDANNISTNPLDNRDPTSNADRTIGKVEESHCFTWVGELVRYAKANYIVLIIFAILLVVAVETASYLRGKFIKNDIECYETEEDDE